MFEVLGIFSWSIVLCMVGVFMVLISRFRIFMLCFCYLVYSDLLRFSVNVLLVLYMVSLWILFRVVCELIRIILLWLWDSICLLKMWQYVIGVDVLRCSSEFQLFSVVVRKCVMNGLLLVLQISRLILCCVMVVYRWFVVFV